MKKVYLMGISFFLTLGLMGQNSDKHNTKIQSNSDSFTDSRDGHFYHIVTIGNQIWMAENLKFLPEVTSASNGSNAEGYYYVYGYEGTDTAEAKVTENYQTYGALYNFTAAQDACPTGWHLPSEAEWLELITFAGGINEAAAKLKEVGAVHWQAEDDRVTNELGFTALPGGYRKDNGTFGSLNANGYWWCSTSFTDDKSWTHGMYYATVNVGKFLDPKNIGASVRCVSDDVPSAIQSLENAPIHLSVFPNPANNYISLTIDDSKVQEWQFEILNSNGSVIKSGLIRQQNAHIDITNLSTGNYFVRVSQNQRHSKTIKFIKR